MPFINNLLKYESLSIVGLDKNTGKTVCLNYVLKRLHELGVPCAVTSIGVDGEQTDAVFGSAKPEITLYENTSFITSERHYRLRQLVSELTYIDTDSTSLGRLVTGRVLIAGKILLSGAASTDKLKQQIAGFKSRKVPLTIVDGALSRLSLASPTVTDAMILATGAAVSVSLPQLIAKTRFVHDLINVEEVDKHLQPQLSAIGKGLWAIDEEQRVHDLKIPSVFLLDKYRDELFSHGQTFFVSGAVSDKLVRYLTSQNTVSKTCLIARDFTKLFISPEVLAQYYSKGGSLKVLQRSKLVAVCLNPTSPRGYNLRSEEACAALSEALEIPVYDVMKCERHGI